MSTCPAPIHARLQVTRCTNSGSAAWVRPTGSKTTEWIGGVTVNDSAPSSEPVDLRPAFTDGFRTIRIPTTVGGTTAAIGDWYDYVLYVDDFAIATSEADLPLYP